jgi:hypothetical protein
VGIGGGDHVMPALVRCGQHDPCQPSGSAAR